MTLFELIGQPVNARMVEGNRNPTALAMARLRSFKMLQQPCFPGSVHISVFLFINNPIFFRFNRYFSD